MFWIRNKGWRVSPEEGRFLQRASGSPVWFCPPSFSGPYSGLFSPSLEHFCQLLVEAVFPGFTAAPSPSALSRGSPHSPSALRGVIPQEQLICLDSRSEQLVCCWAGPGSPCGPQFLPSSSALSSTSLTASFLSSPSTFRLHVSAEGLQAKLLCSKALASSLCHFRFHWQIV